MINYLDVNCELKKKPPQKSKDHYLTFLKYLQNMYFSNIKSSEKFEEEFNTDVNFINSIEGCFNTESIFNIKNRNLDPFEYLGNKHPNNYFTNHNSKSNNNDIKYNYSNLNDGNIEDFRNKFDCIGIFCYCPSLDKNRKNDNFTIMKIYKNYYSVYYRKSHLHSKNFIDEFFLVDVTVHINHRNKLLDDKNAKLRLFTKLSHEFKTPINSIIGIIESLQENQTQFSHPNKSKLKIINNLSHYVIFLISDIIQYSCLSDISDIKINKSNIDISEILNFSFDILNSLLQCNKLKKENIRTKLVLDKNISSYTVQADEIRLKQVMLNFISNAVKFTNRGKIKIKAKVKVRNLKHVLKIYVKDTGIGIEEHQKSGLFSDNAMIHNEENKYLNSFGSGLGLSICKFLLEKMEFNYEMKSQYKKGSKFTILIPIDFKHEKTLISYHQYSNGERIGLNISFSDLNDIIIENPNKSNKLSFTNLSNKALYNLQDPNGLNKNENFKRRYLFNKKSINEINNTRKLNASLNYNISLNISGSQEIMSDYKSHPVYFVKLYNF